MKISRRQLLKLSACTAITVGLPNLVMANRSNGVAVETGPAFGSAWRLVTADTANVPLARKNIETVINRVDRLMSPFRTDSELARFNDAHNVGATRGMVISSETLSVTRTALDIARASDGAFDPTCAPIGRRFGFGSTLIKANRSAGNYHDLLIRGRKLQAAKPGLSIDLCAIAKGHALDEILLALDGMDFLLELGGEIAARGRHPHGRAWRAGIERPGEKKLQRVIEWKGRALATSANGLSGYALGGHRYGHVVDPRTAKPVSGKIAQVSILAPTSRLADGLATTALVLGPVKAREMLGEFDASALFLMRNGAEVHEVDVLGFNKV